MPRTDPLRNTLDQLAIDPGAKDERRYLASMLRRLGYTEREIEEALGGEAARVIEVEYRRGRPGTRPAHGSFTVIQDEGWTEEADEVGFSVTREHADDPALAYGWLPAEEGPVAFEERSEDGEAAWLESGDPSVAAPDDAQPEAAAWPQHEEPAQTPQHEDGWTTQEEPAAPWPEDEATWAQETQEAGWAQEEAPWPQDAVQNAGWPQEADQETEEAPTEPAATWQEPAAAWPQSDAQDAAEPAPSAVPVDAMAEPEADTWEDTPDVTWDDSGWTDEEWAVEPAPEQDWAAEPAADQEWAEGEADTAWSDSASSQEYAVREAPGGAWTPTEEPFTYGEYTLHTRLTELSGGREQRIYFFAKDAPKSGEPCPLPEGYVVEENDRTGMPFLRRQTQAATQCLAVTQAGSQCRNAPRDGSKYCTTHKGWRGARVEA